MQRAGFEPANHYGLGPKPSAFDQARLPLLRLPDTPHGQNYYTQELAKFYSYQWQYP
jgi:hypothetical protein